MSRKDLKQAIQAASHHLGQPTVVKVQRPLTGGSYVCLIYDEKRAHVVQKRIEDAVLKLMDKQQGVRAYKNFFSARWNSRTKDWDIETARLAPWQEW